MESVQVLDVSSEHFLKIVRETGKKNWQGRRWLGGEKNSPTPKINKTIQNQRKRKIRTGQFSNEYRNKFKEYFYLLPKGNFL